MIGRQFDPCLRASDRRALPSMSEGCCIDNNVVMSVATISRSQLKKVFDSLENNNFKKNFLNALPFWAGAFITGLIAVLYAHLFALAESGTGYLFHRAAWSFFIITPLCFLVAWWIT